jgi:DinB superfamily
MRTNTIALTALLTLGGFALQAQSAAGPAAEIKTAYTSVKNNLLKSAEKAPDEVYSFMPTPDERTFAEVLNHVVEAQTRVCSTLLGETKTATTGKTKAEVITGLNAAFAECDKAYDALTDANAADTFKFGPRQRSRLAALTGNISHDNEQYGILSVYMRLKNIVPPSSDAVPKR